MYRFYSNGVEYELDIEVWDDEEGMIETDPTCTDIFIKRKEDDGTTTEIKVEHLK